jgi:hypothetical protein
MVTEDGPQPAARLVTIAGRFATVSSGTSFTEVAGVVLGRRGRVRTLIRMRPQRDGTRASSWLVREMEQRSFAYAEIPHSEFFMITGSRPRRIEPDST